jgi:NitT/TauT family transport system substrate-binding protein
MRRALTALLALAALGAVSACGASSSASEKAGPARELRLGYFANVTHAAAVYGVGTGLYQQALGGTTLKTQVFSAGPTAVEALFAGAVDAAYVGPNPAVNAFVQSKGEAVRIVAGATSGGAALVVKPSITDVSQLRGKRIADPQTGGTQDVALRTLLAANKFDVDISGAGDVTVVAQDSGATLDLFKGGQIDGGWVPEPWASRLVLDGGGRVLVDEKSLWPGGRFVTTNLVVRTEFLAEHPETVEALLRGQVAAGKAINADKPRAQQVVNAQLERLTGKALAPAVIARAFANIEVTDDPLAATLQTSAAHARAVGLLRQADLEGIYDLTLLRKVLGRPVDDAGLGKG